MGYDKGFEWKRTLEEVGASSLHFAPEPRSWYHYCIPEVLDILDQYKPDLLIGASMGGYAALMFSGLTNIRATVFGPQTTLEDVPWDRRWQHEWITIRQRTKRPDLIDLIELKHNPESHIYYAVGCLEDNQHAKRFKGKLKITYRGVEKHEDAAKDLPKSVFD